MDLFLPHLCILQGLPAVSYTHLFNTPAFLLMLVVLIGHLLQKSPFEKTISGTLKAGIGFLVISSGSGIVTGALTVFEPLWSEVFGPVSYTHLQQVQYFPFSPSVLSAQQPR